MERAPRFMEDKLLTGGGWVANRGYFEGVQRPSRIRRHT
jgi:hypothetical protein